MRISRDDCRRGIPADRGDRRGRDRCVIRARDSHAQCLAQCHDLPSRAIRADHIVRACRIVPTRRGHLSVRSLPSRAFARAMCRKWGKASFSRFAQLNALDGGRETGVQLVSGHILSTNLSKLLIQVHCPSRFASEMEDGVVERELRGYRLQFPFPQQR